jgi:hypothetical protein
MQIWMLSLVVRQQLLLPRPEQQRRRLHQRLPEMRSWTRLTPGEGSNSRT